MAIDHIVINTGVRGGQQLQALADSLRQFRAQLKIVRDAASHCQDGATYTQLESDLGVPSGKGGDVWFMLDNLNTKLNTDGQITGLLSDLDTFTGRVG